MQFPVYALDAVGGDGTSEHPLGTGGGGGGTPGGVLNSVQINDPLGHFGGDNQFLYIPLTQSLISVLGGGAVDGSIFFSVAGPTSNLDLNLVDQDVQLDAAGGISITNQESAANTGIHIFSNDGGDSSANIDISTEASGVAESQILMNNVNGVRISGKANGVNICNNGPTDTLSFFGVTPVVQQATPVTLGDVIAVLHAYGLTA